MPTPALRATDRRSSPVSAASVRPEGSKVTECRLVYLVSFMQPAYRGKTCGTTCVSRVCRAAGYRVRLEPVLGRRAQQRRQSVAHPTDEALTAIITTSEHEGVVPFCRGQIAAGELAAAYCAELSSETLHEALQASARGGAVCALACSIVEQAECQCGSGDDPAGLTHARYTTPELLRQRHRAGIFTRDEQGEAKDGLGAVDVTGTLVGEAP